MALIPPGFIERGKCGIYWAPWCVGPNRGSLSQLNTRIKESVGGSWPIYVEKSVPGLASVRSHALGNKARPLLAEAAELPSLAPAPPAICLVSATFIWLGTGQHACVTVEKWWIF